MAIQTISDLLAILAIELGDTAASLSTDQKERAANAALSELGWVLPCTDAQEFWVVRRAVRHAIFFLVIDSARKFKYNNINLQQRFEHYTKLVQMMDTEYGIAVKDNIVLFGNVTPSSLFGDVIPAGFSYTTWGQEITYLVSGSNG